ncbi:hypothetical protein PBY51_013910 [Eleginops maclovinus]|uniref:Uncharacterized protein n=1 Tax=Eleginops maclovinus TaxID=56733 RepID=A0AAN7WJ75_ELEMC|nr:hypothetical protein PBY51_013910 [Eleginops maclovinus]
MGLLKYLSKGGFGEGHWRFTNSPRSRLLPPLCSACSPRREEVVLGSREILNDVFLSLRDQSSTDMMFWSFCSPPLLLESLPHSSLRV